ncbi:hypothetical protein ACQEUU_37280 [Nonomuraea sp. CA-218870]|uniref:hypothetical protein n=1 Tax=Nonomuraea sp. CA-218870 TaxID=3239998 RepID=UPI003D8AA7F7
MSIRTETRFFVACDGVCGMEYHVQTDDSALAARISAGMAGWRHISARPGGKSGKGKRLASDLCPDCAEAKGQG